MIENILRVVLLFCMVVIRCKKLSDLNLWTLNHIPRCTAEVLAQYLQAMRYFSHQFCNSNNLIKFAMKHNLHFVIFVQKICILRNVCIQICFRIISNVVAINPKITPYYFFECILRISTIKFLVILVYCWSVIK